ncbi:MAG TPA: CoA-binding protein [Acidimicrobiaceae bacterium]|nr:CoA-binding protein [Acidimicrobiaceae bacterium]HAX04220.1 CoA-binding protein [Acidimicrobiaceae bacterium]|tara:strand:+ start:334 stop:834 length:501 start_codon:yes stop_codon:yes gene_type:complete
MTTTHEPVPGWTEPTATGRLELLKKTRSIAMVGVSANSSRPSNFVATYLLSSSADFEVYFVNPMIDEIFDQPCHSTLEDLPVTPDMVNVFRRSEDLPEVAEQAVAIGAQSFWTQLGLWNVEAATIALQAELDLVMDRCLKIEHARFHGGLHLAGFDTGVIDSRLGA